MGQRAASPVKAAAPALPQRIGRAARWQGAGARERGMSDLPEDRFAGSSLRMAAVSLLLHQVMRRANPQGRKLGRAAAARERVGHDLTSLLDGAFGGHGEHAPEGVGGIATGLEGLAHSFRQHGMAREVESWIGDGPNLPVTPQQAAMVLDMEAVDSLAQRAGSDRESLLREVAAVLPEFVHRMTPDGRVPEADRALRGEALSGALGGLMGGAPAPTPGGTRFADEAAGRGPERQRPPPAPPRDAGRG
jgi:uncharacterized protein YidB (DUF937 family)